MGLESPRMGSARAVASAVFIFLLIFYSFFVYAFRPSNPLPFPEFEDRLVVVLYILFISNALFYAGEILSIAGAVPPMLLRHISALFFALVPLAKKSSVLLSSNLSSLVQKIIAASGSLFLLFAKLFPALRGCFAFLNAGILSQARKALAAIAASASICARRLFSFLATPMTLMLKPAREHLFLPALSIAQKFLPSGKYYFATCGLFIFLALSPLFIFGKREMADFAALIFAGYAVFSHLRRLDPRIMIVASILFLAGSPILIAMQESARAELCAIYAYYSLCAGVLLQAAHYTRSRGELQVENEAANCAAHAQSNGQPLQKPHAA